MGIPDWQAKVWKLCDDAERAANSRRYAKAIGIYESALTLVPDPQCPDALALVSNIGDCYFTHKKYREALTHFQRALAFPEGESLHLRHRIGQCHFELGELEQARTELRHVLEHQRFDMFQHDDPKYLAFAREPG